MRQDTLKYSIHNDLSILSGQPIFSFSSSIIYQRQSEKNRLMKEIEFSEKYLRIILLFLLGLARSSFTELSLVKITLNRPNLLYPC